MQAKAYSDVQDSSLAVSVSGDIGEAKALQNNNENNSGEIYTLMIEIHNIHMGVSQVSVTLVMLHSCF